MEFNTYKKVKMGNLSDNVDKVLYVLEELRLNNSTSTTSVQILAQLESKHFINMTEKDLKDALDRLLQALLIQYRQEDHGFSIMKAGDDRLREHMRKIRINFSKYVKIAGKVKSIIVLLIAFWPPGAG